MDRNPFIVDGPVPPDSPLYVAREADRHIFKLIKNDEIVHLVGPPGTGKTSLIQRTADRFAREGVDCVVINLSDFDTAETEGDWYQQFVRLLAQRMSLDIEGYNWLRRSTHEGTVHVQSFVERYLLSERTRSTILFIDEFEALERKGFTQPFFEFIRRVYEGQPKTRQFHKVPLVLAGTRPFALAEYLSPESYVSGVQLTDFTQQEASHLRDEFLLDGMIIRLDEMNVIYEWTGGHPYLTQRACWEVYKTRLEAPASVGDLIRNYFLDPNLTDPNLDYIRRALEVEGAQILREYQRLLLGSSIVNRGALEYLAAIGLLKPDINNPQVRNRIYREVFNEKWVDSKLREKLGEELFDGRDLSAIPGGFTIENRYELKRLLGSGPAGNVYVAEDRRLGLNVAVRIISANFLLNESNSEEETLAHFGKCLRDAARLHHPKIVRIMDFGFSRASFFYVVRDYMPDENIALLLHKTRRPGTEATLQILTHAVEAIAAAHDAGVRHGDLNPFKIFISQRDPDNNVLSVKVADFGMAKLMNEVPGLPASQPPRPGQVGDPAYMAPEQLVPGDTPWDERADIYSLGLIAYQLFGGDVPQFQNLSNILKIKQEKDFAPLNVSEEIRRAIMWALEPEPNDRPASIREWFDVLSTAIRQEIGGSESEIPETPQPHALPDFTLNIVPIVLTSPLAFDREETFTVETVVDRANEEVYGQISITPDVDNLPGAVFVGVIRQASGSRKFKEAYERAKREALKTFIYIKREATKLVLSRDPDAMPQNEFEELKKDMLADAGARFFDTPDDFADVFYNDLAEWLINQYLPDALKQARQSSAEVITALLDNVRNPEALPDQVLLHEVRRRQVELTGQYWFYLSCAEDDLPDEDIHRFFDRLNAEVRKLAGTNQFYVGTLRVTGTVARTALREEWFPETVLALQNSRVLVPLYTPNYFKSEMCGKIWEFFQLRNSMYFEEHAIPRSIVLPVLWSPSESLPYPLPDTVSRIQYVPSEFGVRGVREMKHRNRDRYEQFVRDLAQRLVDMATSYRFPPLPEPPSYSEIQNAFAPPTAETHEPAATDAYQPPPAGRSIFVADSASGEVTDEIRITGTELGRELARRGYGLLLYGRTNVDYYVKAAFDEQPAEETSVKGFSKSVHPPPDPRTFSGGTSLLFGSELAYIVELVQQSDAVIVIGGREGPYDFHEIAEEYSKPVFTFEEFFPQLEEYPSTTRQLVRKLLDAIDGLWLSPAKPRTEAEALASLAFMQGDLLSQAVGAIVNFVGINPIAAGAVGSDLARRLGEGLLPKLESQGPLKTADTLVTRVDQHLSATYVIHACSESQSGPQTIESSTQAVGGALRRAELLGLETIAFPSVGTGGGNLPAESVAPSVLRSVLDHLTEGSHLKTVLFAFKNQQDYNAYYDTFISLGGRPGYRVLSLDFSEPVLAALRLAETAHVQLGRKYINSSLLLWALYKVDDGPTRELLESCKTPNGIDLAFQERLGTTDEAALANLEPAAFETLPFLRCSPNTDEAFVRAKELASGNISERHLLAGLLSVFKSSATRWLALLTGLDAADLYDIVADEQKSIASEIASRQATTISVETTAWTLNLSSPQANGQNLNNVRVGERFTITLSLEPASPIPGANPPQNLLRIPVNSLELTGWIRAPGFQLQVELPFSIKLIDGAPEPRSFSFELKPLLSGSRPVEVEIYPGGRVSNLGPTLIASTLTVAPPVVLPDIKELIDRRQIPHPQPDVMLYVALEETPNGQQTRMYLTCAPLELDREILDPLPLDETAIAELTANAIESAACANGTSPSDALAAVRAAGADLFDHLVNGQFLEHFHQIRALAGITDRRWSWLIISDEKAILPWELVNYYGFDEKTGEIRYDEFFADQFQICHWVGQHGLRLMNSAPMGELDLIHYGQPAGVLKGWETAVGPGLVRPESDAAQMSLLKEDSYCFGLHLLRFTETLRSNQIVAVETEQQNGRTEGEAITGDQKLDLTLRRPTVGLSLVSDDTRLIAGRNWCNTELESNWLIPFMHAGASAAYGPRWPVSVEADQAFVQEFYDVMRQGETLGVAFSKARTRVRTCFPHRTDWLAYSYFGHPHAEPYWVQRAQGFALLEAVNQPEGELFCRGRSYRFRVSYRSEAPAWYDGRLHVQEHDVSAEEMSVMVMPLSGVEPTYYKLERVAQSNEMQKVFSLEMPQEGDTLPVMVRFQRQTQELRTLFMNLQIGEEG